ncbi:hypothetical protein Tco_0858892 [Tanacetum coccineum]|uniref:Uncharacterized protein n=1 Tax=Tanacetum coccineum TaxID=301880 RepID=A0ABQ5BAG0_9ASTR
MENSKRGSIPMQDKLRLSKSQGASTPAELKRMQSVPYASAWFYNVSCDHVIALMFASLQISDGCMIIPSSLRQDMCSFKWRCCDWKSAKQSIFRYFHCKKQSIFAALMLLNGRFPPTPMFLTRDAYLDTQPSKNALISGSLSKVKLKIVS